jgi:hypothetical protein
MLLESPMDAPVEIAQPGIEPDKTFCLGCIVVECTSAKLIRNSLAEFGAGD